MMERDGNFNANKRDGLKMSHRDILLTPFQARYQTALEGQTVTISVTEYNQYPYTQLAKGMLHVVDIRNGDTVFFTADDLNFTNTCVRVLLIAISASLLAWSIYIFFRKTRKAKKTGDKSVSR